MNYNENMRLTLGEVAFVTKLAGFEYTKNLSGNFIEEGIPVIQGRNIKDGILNFDNMKYISLETSNDLPRSQVHKNTILLSYVGTVGDVYIHQDSSMIHLGSNVAKIKPDESLVLPNYLYYFIKSPMFVDDMLSKTKGSVQLNINMRDLRSIKISLPLISEQKNIINILSSIDNKIKLNNKINSNLEEMAQTLYKHWFVNFEFPNEDGLPYKSSDGKMIESEMGMIPENFKITNIGDNFKTILGGTPARKNKEYWGKGYNWINSSELNKLRILKGTEEITKLGLDNSAAKIMPRGTTVIGITGYVGIVSMLEIDCSANQSVVGIIPNEIFTKSYIYSMIKVESPILALKQTGSAQQHINKNDVNTHKFISPTHELISKYEKMVSSINDKIYINLVENEKLVKLRDLLLPKLMNGEIRVPIKE